MTAALVAEKSWTRVRLALLLTVKDIYIISNQKPLTKFTSSSRSTEFKDILAWNISQMITKTIPISTRLIKSYAMKHGIQFWVWRKFQWKLRQQQSFLEISPMQKEVFLPYKLQNHAYDRRTHSDQRKMIILHREIARINRVI